MKQTSFDIVINQEATELKVEARARFLPHALQVQYSDRTVEYPWGRLRMELAGFKKHLIFVEFPGNEGYFYLEKSAMLLESMQAIQDIRGQSLSKGMRSGNFQSQGLILFFVLALISSLYGVWQSQDLIVKGVASLVKDEHEKKVGETALNLIVPKDQRITDAKVNESVAKLMSPLLAANKIDPKSITIIVSRDQNMNAFAFMGGYLIFNKGLINQAESAEEFLGVGAHELAHITQRHSLRSAIKSVGIYAIISLALSDVSGLIALLADQGRFLLQQGYSRDFEREADAHGFNYLINAKIHPSGLLSFFKKIDAKSEAPKNKEPANDEKKSETEEKLEKAISFMSTHPMTSERIETIEGKIQALDKNIVETLAPVNFDWKAFQQLVAAESI